MKKKALRKDFYMEIRRSLGRFLSIFFIVAIGCAFFSGIRASEPDMRYSGDTYFDKKNMMDIQVISTLGLTDDDLQAIESVDGVEYAEGGYSVDVLCTEGDNQIAVHVMALMPTMNQVQLEEGRLPEAEDECALDVDYLNESSLEIGDEITFSSGSEDEITDTLKADTFTITGAVSSPNYISFQRGSTTIGNGSLTAFIVVPESSFVLDVYTEIYAQVDGAKDLTAFTDAYDERIQDVMDQIEEIKDERQKARYDEVVDEADEELEKARQEVADAEKELEDGRVEAETELADARQKLEDARSEVDSGRQEIESSRAELESSRQQLKDSQEQVDQGQEELNANIDTLNEQIDELNAAKEQYNALAASGATDDVTMAALKALYEQIRSGEAAIAQAQAQARELIAKDQITQTAQAEAADIIAKAHEEGRAYIQDAKNQASEILSDATTKANEMLTNAQNKSREMLTAVNTYADDTLLAIDDALYKALSDVRRIRQGLSNKHGE